MTGKTSLLKRVHADWTLDLLDTENELRYRVAPRILWEKLQALPDGAWVIIDEIQRVPTLLDFVQMGMDRKGQNFFLSGSSARKLKRGSANLLGGRAASLKLHPISSKEVGLAFDLQGALELGTLPKILTLRMGGEVISARLLLQSYITTYLKEEIQAEALVRALDAFQRFLPVAAQHNGQVVEYVNIGRDCSVSPNTVKNYFEVLEDTLIGQQVWPVSRSERKKARPKFYLFDCGVVRALQNRLIDPPTTAEVGFLFETWFLNELRCLNDYGSLGYEIHFWRKGTNEIDFVLCRGGAPKIAFECKSGANITQDDLRSSIEFKRQFPRAALYIVSMYEREPRKTDFGIEILPWRQALETL